MSLQCTECSREFSVKSNLTRHLRMVHGAEVARIDILPGDFNTYHYKCLEGCNISFKYNRELRKHLRSEHEIDVVELNLEFPNSEEFHKWLHNEENSNYVQYVHLTATKRKTTGTETYYYECSRTGKRSVVDDTIRKRRTRKVVTKLNRGCTSQIIVNKLHDGSFSVVYFKSHYGHETDVEHLKLSKQDRASIASKLLLGLPVSSVLHSAKKTDGDVKRINLLGRKDIVNIRKSFNIDLKDGKAVSRDAMNVNLFLRECGAHECNPVLHYASDEICLVLMTKYQSEVLREAGGNIVAVSSLSLNGCDFELISLFVINQSWESFPAACMFASGAHGATYELFFGKIKERAGAISPSVLITNCDEMFYESWRSVMGEVGRAFYSPVQVDVDWKLKLNRVVCGEPEVARVKRRWIYDSLKSLQATPDVGEFVENLEATVRVLRNDEDVADFLQYFLRSYGHAERWADCFKVGTTLPLKQLQITADVLKQYLNEEVEARFDKIFHSLIRFVRDETVNYMLKSKANRVYFLNENDSRHKLSLEGHLNGVHVGENLWNVENKYKDAYVVQKHLEKKCCNLVCSTCNICVHCFSCSCVDFFLGNAICVHIHHVWMTYFQSIIQNEDRDPSSCDDEIIIQFDEAAHEDDAPGDDVADLKKAIVDRTTVLCNNIHSVEDSNALTVVLNTLDQLCDLCLPCEDAKKSDETEKDFLDDHSYV